MTLADQAAIAGHDGQVTSGKPERPKSRMFTWEFKAKLVAEFGALPANSPERGAPLAYIDHPAANATYLRGLIHSPYSGKSAGWKSGCLPVRIFPHFHRAR
jgi:hypothetical protein